MKKPIPFGPYLLLQRIAVGGMAEVYLATRRGAPAGRLFAVKRILPTLVEDHEFLTMFLDEARLVVQLDHPGIVPLHELGKHGDGYYIALEYVPGRDLRALLEVLRRGGERMPAPLAAHVAARVADALDHAHRKRDARGEPLRVVHRDVSPANVLVGFDGSVRIIDFGIAQAAIRTRRAGTVLRGKFGYMSPELVRGDAVDHRADVFALGVVLHEMLTGKRLFRGASELAVMEQVRRGDVPPPSRLEPSVPRALDEVVLRALAPEPESRYAWASELREALAPWAESATPPADGPALARLMARCFPAELRAELDRLERLRRTPVAPGAAPDAEPERTQAFAVRFDPPAPDASEGPTPAFRAASLHARADGPARASGRRGAPLLAAAAAAGVLGASFVLAASKPASDGAALSGPDLVAALPAAGRITIQPAEAADVRVDGAPLAPRFAAGEVRTIEVLPGLHRVELVTSDGRSGGATLDVRRGETAKLLGVELR